MSEQPKEQRDQNQIQEPQEKCASEGSCIEMKILDQDDFLVGDINIGIDIDFDDDLGLRDRNNSLTTVSSSSPIAARIESKHVMEPVTK